MSPSYDEVKQGIKDKSFRSKLKQLFPAPMKQLEEWEKEDPHLC